MKPRMTPSIRFPKNAIRKAFHTVGLSQGELHRVVEWLTTQKVNDPAKDNLGRF